jgi:hypothetical protein
MKPPPQGWNSTFWAAVVSPCYSKHYDQVWKELESAVFVKGNITSAEADVHVLLEAGAKSCCVRHGLVATTSRLPCGASA